MTSTMPEIRQRILRTELIPARDLKRHPKNFRKHGEDQRRDVAALLTAIGQVSPVIARQLPDGTIELIDGELRSNIADDRQILVAVTDLSETEAATMLAMLDYTASQATIDPELARQVAEDAADQSGIDPEMWVAWTGSIFSKPETEFTPTLVPSTSNQVVTDAQVVKTGEKMQVTFDSKLPDVLEVTCPHCGKEFGIRK